MDEFSTGDADVLVRAGRRVQALQTQAAAVSLTLMLGVAAWLVAVPGGATLTLASAGVLLVLLVVLVHARMRPGQWPHGRPR